jgi:hypothetical protein
MLAMRREISLSAVPLCGREGRRRQRQAEPKQVQQRRPCFFANPARAGARDETGGTLSRTTVRVGII